MTVRRNRTKARLAAGDIVVGTMVFECRMPSFPAISAAAGCDFIIVDQEATGATTESVGAMNASARGHAIDLLVRVPSKDPHLVGQALDVGVAGVMIPAVDSAEQAASVVRSAQYPPRGRRGVIAGLAASDYRAVTDLGSMLASANDETLVVVQVESTEGLGSVEEIAAIDGVDVLFVGPIDLSVSLGAPGDFTSCTFLAALDRIVAAASTNGKAAAIKVGSVEEGRRRIEAGFRCISYQDDVRVLREGLRAGVDALTQA